MASKRIIFTFDEKSKKALDEVRDGCSPASLAEAVRFGIRLAKAVLEHRKAGYSEIVLRNPAKNTERVLVL